VADDQLVAALEEVEQAHLAVGALEAIVLVHRHHGQAPAGGGQLVTRAGERLLAGKKLRAGGDPGIVAGDLWQAHEVLLSRCLTH
jgi:hypothetical protein